MAWNESIELSSCRSSLFGKIGFTPPTRRVNGLTRIGLVRGLTKSVRKFCERSHSCQIHSAHDRGHVAVGMNMIVLQAGDNRLAPKIHYCRSRTLQRLYVLVRAYCEKPVALYGKRLLNAV